MICFELSINGRRRAIAGVPGNGVLSAHVTWVHYRPQIAERVRKSSDLDVALGGLDSNDPDQGVSLHWLRESLKMGDRVAIRVVDRDVADPPRSRQLEPRRDAKSLAIRWRNLKRSRAQLDREIQLIEKQITRARRR